MSPLSDSLGELNSLIEQAGILIAKRFKLYYGARVAYEALGEEHYLVVRRAKDGSYVLADLVGDPDGDHKTSPLHSCRAELRVIAVSHLDQLWDACMQFEQDVGMKVDRAVERATLFINTHRGQTE